MAFSGGLDTSYCAIYLAKEMGLEVHAALANTGGFSAEELAKIEKRAYDLGVKSYVALDVTQDYYNTAIKYMIFGNVLKNATYPISVSSERMSQATAIAKYAEQIGADYLCHGSTGAGNDQVRFDMVFNIIAPEIEVIALIREKRLSREEEISYLRSHGVDFDFKKAEYSINQGIWGTSVGGQGDAHFERDAARRGLPLAAQGEQIAPHYADFRERGVRRSRRQTFRRSYRGDPGLAGRGRSLCDRP